MHLYRLALKLDFTPATKLNLTYQILKADQSVAKIAALYAVSGTGKDYGTVSSVVLSHAFSKQLNGLLHAEYFTPGNFYVDSASKAIFARWEVNYRF